MVSDISAEDTPDILFHPFRHIMSKDDHSSLGSEERVQNFQRGIIGVVQNSKAWLIR